MTVGSVGTIEVGSGGDGSGTAGGGAAASAAGAEAGAGAVGRSGVWVGFTGDGVGRCADGPDFGCATAALFPAPGTLCFGFAGWFAGEGLAGLCSGATLKRASCGTMTVRLEGEWPMPKDGNGDRPIPSTTITVNRTTAPATADPHSRMSSRREAWTLMIPLSG